MSEKKPVMFLGLADYTMQSLLQVMRTDESFLSEKGLWKAKPPPMGERTDGMLMTEASKLLPLEIVSDADYFGTQASGSKKYSFDSSKQYLAIVTNDEIFEHEDDDQNEACEAFLVEQYEKGVHVLFITVQGTFTFCDTLNDVFGSEWRFAAYTTSSVQLTDEGKQLLGPNAFPKKQVYTKSHFVKAPPEERLLIAMEDVEENSDEETGEPAKYYTVPGSLSPFVAHRNNPSTGYVAYFGFVNSLDFSFGHLVWSFCYASE